MPTQLYLRFPPFHFPPAAGYGQDERPRLKLWAAAITPSSLT